MRYRRKSTTVVEAIQLDTSDVRKSRDALELLGATPGTFEMPLVAGRACWWRQSFPHGSDHPPVYSLILYTESGETEAVTGDWIIRGSEGRIFCMADQEFCRKYEPLAEPV